MDLKTLQTNLPWTTHYHHDFRASNIKHKDFQHALVHVFKAAGKLSDLINQAEHKGCEFISEETDPYIADLVICALRMANTIPNRVCDLEKAVIERIEKKNGLILNKIVSCLPIKFQFKVNNEIMYGCYFPDTKIYLDSKCCIITDRNILENIEWII